MKKILSIFTSIALSLTLSSCIVFRSSDYQVESNRNLLATKYVNNYENNAGVEFPQQILYIPMYTLYGGLSAIFFPFSKDSYKNDLATIVMDFDSVNNLNPTGDPSFFIIPKCKNDLVTMIAGFSGRESELMSHENNQLINNYEIRKEDIYLKDEDQIIKPNSIFIAGTDFDKISSRFAEVHYPIMRKKKKLYRFVEYPYSCSNLIHKKVSFMISKVYKGKNVIRRDIEIKLIKGDLDKPYQILLQ